MHTYPRGNAKHRRHYDFNALLLIKMQIYIETGGRRDETRRVSSEGKTDYVWGAHDKHRNMINSGQPPSLGAPRVLRHRAGRRTPVGLSILARPEQI